MNKKLLLGGAGGLVIVLAIVIGVLFVAGDDDDDVASSDAATSQQSQASQPAESAASEPAEAPAVTLVSDYLSNYTIADSGFGTETTVVVDTGAATRTITTNALPNHDTGEFPNDGNPNAISEQSRTYTYSLRPSKTGTATEVRTTGVALNGVKFEPGTAETFTCSTGEVYRYEAIHENAGLGLDFNNAHVQPTGEYHYHGTSTRLADAFDTGEDLVHVGFAADGFMMYYSRGGNYASSYQLGSGERSGSGCEFSLPANVSDVQFSSVKDGSVTSDWEYVAGAGDLDECNGIEINGEYIYILTDEFPFISRCLMGTVAAEAGAGGGGSAAGGSGGAPSGAPGGMPRP